MGARAGAVMLMRADWQAEMFRLWRYLLWALVGALLLYAALVDRAVYPFFYALAALGMVAVPEVWRGRHALSVSALAGFWVLPVAGLALWTLFAGWLQVGDGFWQRHETSLMLSYLLLPGVVMGLWHSRLDGQWLFRVIIIASLYSVPYDIAACIKQDARGVGALSLPIIRGDMGMLLGLAALTAMLGVEGRWWRRLAAAGFVGGVYLSVMSGSRGGWVAFLTALPLAIWFVRHHAPQRQELLWGAVLTLLVLVVLCPNTLGARIQQTVLSLFGFFFEDEYRTSLGWRFVMWKAAFWGWLQHPWLGWGLGSFWEIFQQYLAVVNMPFNEPFYFHRPHNEYLQFLSEAGLPGLILYLAVYGAPLLWLWRHRRWLADQSLSIKATALLLFVVIEATAEVALSFLSLISIMIGLSYGVLVSAALVVLMRHREVTAWKT